MKATAALAEQSYNKAVNGRSAVNDAKVISQFAERGIDATPRVDVFTYNIWRHQKGRQVMKGEKSVRIVTFIEDKKTGEKRRKTACVFHISQTEAVVTKKDLEDLKIDPSKPIACNHVDHYIGR
jgi:hypothetical protein